MFFHGYSRTALRCIVLNNVVRLCLLNELEKSVYIFKLFHFSSKNNILNLKALF